ncbi:MAG: ATP-binding cassette domain-containing protein [Candidatus Jorgensenbacteria bacterium]|nr:ATP-binding cassette domain-containing protein [Candidatus Jorgensenbacteria bacterium]
MSSDNEIILRFDNVSFEFGHNKHIFEDVSFSVRNGMKVALMGQNGSGKSTLFNLIMRTIAPESGKINVKQNLLIATALQVIPRKEMDMTVSGFFEKRFAKKIYNIDPLIDRVLEVVNMPVPHDRIIKSFSGGQQARLLLASALIQDPDILLLDEPTNNLDKAGIEHLTEFLKNYKKTVVVISHDASFLNSFTDGVLYLDSFTKKIEQYFGNYSDVVGEILIRIEKENRKNAKLAKEIQENKDKANFFAHKGGQMRLVARRMRERAEELEEAKVDVRKEDKAIRSFIIPSQPELVDEIIKITSFKVIKHHKAVTHKANISLKRRMHLLLRGPNGIGKSTLLEMIAERDPKSVIIAPSVRFSYYKQDFSMLNFEDTVRDSLIAVSGEKSEVDMRGIAAGFLIDPEMMNAKIGNLSEGQKGLVAFAKIVLLRPGLLILDEPTNHINFRHIPIIAEALNKYEGAMILVSHVKEFVDKIRIDEILDLDK